MTTPRIRPIRLREHINILLKIGSTTNVASIVSVEYHFILNLKTKVSSNSSADRAGCDEDHKFNDIVPVCVDRNCAKSNKLTLHFSYL